jgi:hypothetical protein
MSCLRRSRSRRLCDMARHNPLLAGVGPRRKASSTATYLSDYWLMWGGFLSSEPRPSGSVRLGENFHPSRDRQGAYALGKPTLPYGRGSVGSLIPSTRHQAIVRLVGRALPDVWAFDHSAGFLWDAAHRRAKADLRNAKIRRHTRRWELDHPTTTSASKTKTIIPQKATQLQGAPTPPLPLAEFSSLPRGRSRYTCIESRIN